MNGGHQVKIAVIGWGSLIWDGQCLDVEPSWRENGPMLPVEFGRFSGRNRLTLVLVDGVPLQRTLWSLSKKESIGAAIENLGKREGTSVKNIGRWSRCGGPSSISGIASMMAQWAMALGVDGVDGAVWTALGPNTTDGKDGLVPSEERVNYLKRLVVAGKAEAAREYVERAPAQVETLLRQRIRKELGWR